jgi:hypothetical protein
VGYWCGWFACQNWLSGVWDYKICIDIDSTSWLHHVISNGYLVWSRYNLRPAQRAAAVTPGPLLEAVAVEYMAARRHLSAKLPWPERLQADRAHHRLGRLVTLSGVWEVRQRQQHGRRCRLPRQGCLRACLDSKYFPKFHYVKRRFSITLKCRHMHGVLNVDEIKN